MIFGYPPWNGYNHLFKSRQNDPLKFPEKKDVDEKLKDLIGKMLVFDQDERLDLKGCLQHDVMKRADSETWDEKFKKKEKNESYEEMKSTINVKKHKSKDVNVNREESERKEEEEEEKTLYDENIPIPYILNSSKEKLIFLIIQ